MFLHSTEDYDFLVQLDPKVLPRYFHNINPDDNLLLKRGKYANKLNEKDMLVFPGFDPARLLFDDLKVCVNSLLLNLDHHWFRYYSPPYSLSEYIPTRSRSFMIHLVVIVSVSCGILL
jgi:Nrap protein domain 6